MYVPLLVSHIAGVLSSHVISKLLWSNYDANDIYGSVSLSHQISTPLTFATATNFGHNSFGVANASSSSSFYFQVEATIVPGCSSNSCPMYIDQARHTTDERSAAVDTFVLVVGNGDCTIMGYVSSGESVTGEAAWVTTLVNCSAGEGVGGAYRCFEASDDGTRVAIQAYGFDHGILNQTARAYVLEGQSGKLLFTYDLKASETAGQGDVAITPDGSWVAYVNEDSQPTPNSAQMHVLDGTTGALRAEVQIPFFIAAAISDSGDYIVAQNFTHLVGSQVWIMKWDGFSYVVRSMIDAPSDFDAEYVVWDVQTTTITATGQEVGVVGWISAPDVLKLRVTLYDLATGALLSEWAAEPSKQYQNNPTIRAHEAYVALALWGDNNNTPTVVLLKAGSNFSLFEFTSPGSMFSSDIMVDSASTSQDVVYLVAAGKHVPANVFGGGGDAYAWEISVPK